MAVCACAAAGLPHVDLCPVRIMCVAVRMVRVL